MQVLGGGTDALSPHNIPPMHYSSSLKTLVHIIRNDGISAVYRGLLSPTLGFGLTFAISFSSYGQGCKLVSHYNSKPIAELNLLELSLAGSFAGLMQSPVRQIVERVKTVMQIPLGPNKKYKSSLHCVIDLLRNKTLFQGFSSVLLREIPQFAIYYPSYEFFKTLFSKTAPLNQNPTVPQFLAGGTAGVLQWLPPIYCFDVIKSRMQSCSADTYRNISHCATTLYQTEGTFTFFRGLTPALLRAFLLHSIIFVSYEWVMSELHS
eukprot:gene7802-10597_t